MAQFARISACGMSVPDQVWTNQYLEQLVETSDEWVRSRTGIAERRIAVPEEYTSTLAVQAATQVLARAAMSAADIDLILVATATPDYVMPSTACVVQEGIGAVRAAAMDVGAACAGFVYALSVGAQYVENGTYRNVLVIGAETFSRIVDWTDRGTCVLFGDGAGAVLLQPSERRTGLLSFILGTHGAGMHLLYVPAGGSRQPATPESVARREHFIRMDGKEIFKFAVRNMGEAVEQVLQKAGLQLADVHLVIPHQANIRIIDAMAKRLGVAREKVFINVDRYGNTSAASIPIALCEALEGGRIHPGDYVVLVGFGSGLTWGAAVLQWDGLDPGTT